MKVFKSFLKKLRLGNARIARQIYTIYALVLLIPLSILGIELLVSGNRMLNDHCIELLEADNLRVKTLLSEVTTQAYSVSDDIGYDAALKQLLTGDYDSYSEYIDASNGYSKLDELLYGNQELDSIIIYSDNPTVKNYKQFRVIDQQTLETGWYQQALSSSGGFWVSIPANSYGNNLSNLCLVRQILLPESAYHAVLVIRLSDSYIRSRIDSSSVTDALSIDDGGIVYSSRRGWYAQEQPVDIDREEDYFRYSGITQVDGNDCFAAVSTLHLYKTNCKLYVCTLDNSGISTVRGIVNNWIFLLLAALLVPGIILAIFTHHFSHRVKLLREEMHKASSQDYNMIADFGGNDELTQAFEDLKLMVQDIKDKNARMYEAELRQNELHSTQQIMEYKMLASQINPHYLYNALETIRMKALTGGDRAVADAIKILGKTLHYVMENTGTAYTTLQRELEHVENYLAIQKLRFGDRVDYSLYIQPGLDPKAFLMLPLLLQPLVENAVVHGLESVDGVGQISLRVTREAGQLHVTVVDNGAGIAPQELENIRSALDTPERSPQSGIALYNIHRRLRLSYGEIFGLSLESELGQGTKVVMTIPMEEST